MIRLKNDDKDLLYKLSFGSLLYRRYEGNIYKFKIDSILIKENGVYVRLKRMLYDNIIYIFSLSDIYKHFKFNISDCKFDYNLFDLDFKEDFEIKNEKEGF